MISKRTPMVTKITTGIFGNRRLADSERVVTGSSPHRGRGPAAARDGTSLSAECGVVDAGMLKCSTPLWALITTLSASGRG